MTWTALVPLKAAAERKTRLANRLSSRERLDISDKMFKRVMAALEQSPGVSRIAILSPERPAAGPSLWLRDQGRGINAELPIALVSLGSRNVIVIHADLPLVSAADIAALIAVARYGVAIAPDRHESGTNALGFKDAARFPFAFGPGSCALHQQAAGSLGWLVKRPGLAIDIDDGDDLDFAVSSGFQR